MLRAVAVAKVVVGGVGAVRWRSQCGCVVVWCDVVWCGMGWVGLIGIGVVRCGAVRCGTAWRVVRMTALRLVARWMYC